ncbi:MAG: DUF924 family protein [Gammaproteobacteria bacterium]
MDDPIESLLRFWFEPPPQSREELARRFERWFNGGPALDAEIAERFGEIAQRAARGELDGLRVSARGRLALILLLDQLPRHLHRGTAAAYAQDAKALALSTEGIAEGYDRQLAVLERGFFYMPLQHAEDLDTQELSVRMFERLAAADDAPELYRPGLSDMLDAAREHRDVIARFGRFPHRNAALGRADTDAEREYLRAGAMRFLGR